MIIEGCQLHLGIQAYSTVHIHSIIDEVIVVDGSPLSCVGERLSRPSVGMNINLLIHV